MGTRSIILVTGKGQYSEHQTTRIYKHYDGYPTGNLDLINKAIERATKLETEYFGKYLEKRQCSVDSIAGLIIGESVSIYGAQAEIEETFRGPIEGKHFGNQSDLEWIYVVDLNDKTIRIYGGGYFGEGPQKAIAKGTVNPLMYADQLKEEYQAEEKKETLKLITSLEAWGFRVNPKKQKKVG